MIKRNGNTIHLTGREISYVMVINEDGDLINFHMGKKIADRDYASMKAEWAEECGRISNAISLDVYPQEYPSYGLSDLRNPAYEIVNKFGHPSAKLTVKDIIIHENEAIKVKDMPSLYKGDCKADTLEVVLYDEAIDFEARLYYVVFEDYNIIARHAVLINRAAEDIEISSAYSMSLDFPRGDYDMVHFAGAWLRERDFIRTPLQLGAKLEASNARGASGHQMNPFAMICSRDADEVNGEVFGLSLVYSGNHSTVASVDQFGYLRVQQGINPLSFRWTLRKDEEFCTPQSIICYSDKGFGKMSREMHDVVRNNIMTSPFTHKERPILINNWEGTYFDFTEKKLLAIAKKAQKAGIELFVLDDGWFGQRNDDHRGLGDWYVNKKKLPSGIDGLASKINKLGMKFGLWFEPEMVNPDSDLYRAHPDWAVHIDERTPLEMRQQLVLDLTKPEVRDYIVKAVSDILSTANIEYVKWDMNRMITDMPCLGYNHRYTLGFYDIMHRIVTAFPHILFEGCSSGGGRYDLGVLAYMPQFWASDNSDAGCRFKIQYTTSMCYPIYSIGSHVTAVPNHQCGRTTRLKTRGDTAYMGAFGYELDITKCSDDEIKEIEAQVEFEKKIRSLMCEGDFYRLVNPYDCNYCSWETVSKDKNRVFLFAGKMMAVAFDKNPKIRLQGLCPDKLYKNTANGEFYGGDLLMNRGIDVGFKGDDFATQVILFEAVE